MINISIIPCFKYLIVAQSENIYSTIPLIITAIVLVSVASCFYGWLLILRVSFFKKAIKTKGIITGLIGAKHKDVVTTDLPQMGVVRRNDLNAAGYLLNIQYETDNYIYTTQTKKTYSNYNQGDTISVYYNPDDPEDCSVDGVYEVNPKLGYGIVSVGFLVVIALIFHLVVA